MYKRKSIIKVVLLGVSLVNFSLVEAAKPKVSKVDVVNVSEVGNVSENQLVYALPKTIIRVEVEVEKTVSKTGPFYRYSQRFLNITDVISEDSEEWTLKSVKITSVGKPDNLKVYRVNFEGENSVVNVNLNQQGVLKGINLSSGDNEVACSFIENRESEILSLEDVNFDNVPLMEKQLTKTSTAAMAEEAANFIYKIRKRRIKMLTCDLEHLPTDGHSYEVIIDELSKVEQQYVELFAGKKVVNSKTKYFDYVPDPYSPESAVLFRFSKQRGVVDATDLSGTPIYIEVKKMSSISIPNIVIEDIKKKSKEPIRHGLYYTVPAPVLVKIIDRNELLLEKEMLLGQYGKTLSMPTSILEKKGVEIVVDETNGALIKISY